MEPGLAQTRGASNPPATLRDAGCPTIADYELLRRIGQGSYGEVWLARGAMGGWRAIKVVFRRSFDQARPFERELGGLRHYEPISREHGNLVAVLHVGQNEAGGYFYYVMELADDQVLGTAVDPARYAPRSLHSDLAVRGRLPATECVRIGIALAEALDHLHSHGLVHRDVKPSNIIFVNGVAKLADVGLVTDTAATHSFVGTEGFLPPEGPGTPQADLYALGKVLYEMMTGRDRKEFPELPTALREWADREGLLELNAVVVKACHSEPRHRYGSAADLRADLEWLAAGRSVRSVRGRRRRWRLSLQIAGLAAAVGLAGWGVREARLSAVAGAARQTLRLRLAQGFERLNRSDPAASLPWFAEAIRTSQTAGEDPGIQRLRFEWIWRECPKPIQLIPRPGPVSQVAFSPDRRHVLAAGEDGLAQVLDLRTGTPRFAAFRHGSPVRTARFSPDGTRVLTASEDGVVRVWDATSGQPSFGEIRHGGPLTCAAFATDSRRVYTGGRDQVVRGWDARTGALVFGPITLESPVLGLAAETTGRYLGVAGEDGVVRILEVETGSIQRLPVRHGGPVTSIEFDGAGERLATASTDRTARVWNVRTGEAVTPPLPHGGLVSRVVFSADGRHVATASHDQTVRIWDSTTGKARCAPLRHGSWVSDVALSPDLRSVLTGGGDTLVRLWDVSGARQNYREFGAAGTISSIAVSADGQWVAAAMGSPAGSGAARIWETQSGRSAGPPLLHEGVVWRVGFSPDGSRLVSASQDGSLQIWHTRSWTWSTAPLQLGVPIWQCRFSGDGQLVLAAGGHEGQPGQARIWNAVTGEPQTTSLRHPSEIMGAAFSSDGRWMITGGGGGNGPGEARLWSTTSGLQAGAPIPSAGAVWDCEFSPDTQRVVIAGLDQSARLWDVRARRPLGAVMDHGGWVVRAVFSPDGRRLATASVDRTARIWDGLTGRPLSSPLRHEGPVNSVAFSSDGRLLLTGSADQTARLWDANSGESITPPLQHDAAIVDVAFVPDSTGFVVATREGRIRIWDLPATTRGLEQYHAMAAVATGVVIDSSGAEARATVDQLMAGLDRLRHKDPGEFPPAEKLR